MYEVCDAFDTHLIKLYRSSILHKYLVVLQLQLDLSTIVRPMLPMINIVPSIFPDSLTSLQCLTVEASLAFAHHELFLEMLSV